MNEKRLRGFVRPNRWPDRSNVDRRLDGTYDLFGPFTVMRDGETNLMKLLVLSPLLFFVGACSSRPACSTSTITAKPSPDGQYTATVGQTECGATSPTTVFVKISSATAGGDDAVFSVYSAAPTVSWPSPRMLRIECSKCSATDIQMQLRSWHDVKIEYGF
jgi:hypothetical protein